MTEDDLIRLLEGLTRDTLHQWIDQGWVQPARQGATYVFAEIDCARVRLIRDVHDTMEVNDEAMPVILSLVDQVYGLRRELRRLALAVKEQPEDVRQAIAERCAALEREE
ncbi:MAG: chaperone modulator CbpM [Candidatus Eiseniibacteriota bacterium]